MLKYVWIIMKALQPEILMNKRGKFIPFIFIEWGTLYTRQEAVCPEYNDWVQLFVKGGYHPANAGMSYAVFNSSISIYLLVFWQYYLCVLYPFQEISGKKLMWKLLRETIGRIWFGFMHLSNCDILVTATHSFILIYSLLKARNNVFYIFTLISDILSIERFKVSYSKAASFIHLSQWWLLYSFWLWSVI